MDAIQSILVYTVVLGSLYLLIALGFSLICGVLGIFNLGYGATFLVAIYGMWMLLSTIGVNLWVAIIGVFILQFLFTLGIIYFPIVKRYMEKEELLLTSLLLVSLIVEETVNHFYPVTAGVDIPTAIFSHTLQLGSVSIPAQMLIVIIAAVLITAFFVYFLMKTRIGFKIRAISQQLEASRLLGVRVERVYALAMILSVVPPTICMLIIAPIWAIEPNMGHSLLQTAILVTILGGLGNLRGTVMASFIVGLIASSVAFLGNPRLVGMSILLVVFFVMIFKPQGIAKSETLW
ncbi:MAG: branched-chain amino acid ABC transporter permease [Syntrophales bacterium]|jgi:branched-chain amino acid transport system permease protein|nr:branched-chain amino acid ABC transporter permease [Syntrophales bacterium]MDY0044289.1 branched-chain amino acid ABC transporter permease [Syntrophales bacterium]